MPAEILKTDPVISKARIPPINAKGISHLILHIPAGFGNQPFPAFDTSQVCPWDT